MIEPNGQPENLYIENLYIYIYIYIHKYKYS